MDFITLAVSLTKPARFAVGKSRISDFVSYLPRQMLLIIHIRKQACTVTISSGEFLFASHTIVTWTSCITLIWVYQTVHGISLEVNEPAFVLKAEQC